MSMDPEELGRQLNRHHRAENDGLWAQCRRCRFMTAQVSAESLVHPPTAEEAPKSLVG
jgi:hypothetical protein